MRTTEDFLPPPQSLTTITSDMEELTNIGSAILSIPRVSEFQLTPTKRGYHLTLVVRGIECVGMVAEQLERLPIIIKRLTFKFI